MALPKQATAYTFTTELVDQADTRLFKSNPTIASGDWKVSKDQGAFANLNTLPSVAPASSRQVKIVLSATEMTADDVGVEGVDAAGAEWCDVGFHFSLGVRNADDLAYPATSGRSMVVDTNGLVDATTVKLGPSGSATAQTANDLGTLLTTVLTESYATDGSTATVAQLLYMIWSLLAERNVSSTTLTAKKLDGTTTSMTFTLNSATQPTAQTRSS